MLITQHVSTFNSFDLRNDRSLGLQSLLFGMSYRHAVPFVRNLHNSFNNSNLFSYIYLSAFMSIPAISAISIYLCNKLSLIEESDMKNLLNQFSPEFTSGISDVLTILSSDNANRDVDIYDYFEYQPFDYSSLLINPSSYYTWLISQEPLISTTVNYLLTGDIPNFICDVLRAELLFEPRATPSLWGLINYWSFVAFSPFVLGHDYNQVFR